MEWLSPEGVVLSNDTTLEIMNIQRNATGIYTCVATHPLSGATMNSTVNVTVQCECMHVMMYIQNYFTCTKNVICVEGELETMATVQELKYAQYIHYLFEVLFMLLLAMANFAISIS